MSQLDTPSPAHDIHVVDVPPSEYVPGSQEIQVVPAAPAVALNLKFVGQVSAPPVTGSQVSAEPRQAIQVVPRKPGTPFSQ